MTDEETGFTYCEDWKCEKERGCVQISPTRTDDPDYDIGMEIPARPDWIIDSESCPWYLEDKNYVKWYDWDSFYWYTNRNDYDTGMLKLSAKYTSGY